MANRPFQLTLNGQSLGPVDIPDDLPMIDYLHD